MFNNSGQSCNAPSRMLVPESRQDEAKAAVKAADETKVGDPNGEDTVIGPVVSEVQFNKIQVSLKKVLKKEQNWSVEVQENLTVLIKVSTSSQLYLLT